MYNAYFPQVAFYWQKSIRKKSAFVNPKFRRVFLTINGIFESFLVFISHTLQERVLKLFYIPYSEVCLGMFHSYLKAYRMKELTSYAA